MLPFCLYFFWIQFLYQRLFQLGLLQKIAKRKNDLRLYADELGKGLVGELDYTLEAANASEFLVLIASLIAYSSHFYWKKKKKIVINEYEAFLLYEIISLELLFIAK